MTSWKILLRNWYERRKGKTNSHTAEASSATAPRLQATPLARFERDGLEAALRKAGLPTDDIDQDRLLFWRFESSEDMPVGFGGLEVHAPDALLRSLVTLPPVRRRGFGAAIVRAIEFEARLLGCRTMYLLTPDASLFARLGYSACKHAAIPKSIGASPHFRLPEQARSTAMVKRFA